MRTSLLFKLATHKLQLYFGPINSVTGSQSLQMSRIETVENISSEMMEAWPGIVAQLSDDSQLAGMTRSLDWLKNLLEKNVPNGKKYRGLALLNTYRALTRNSIRTPQQDRTSIVLAWCLEILQSCALIADDVVDGATTRRGKPCWHLLESVGNSAILDVLLLESAVNRLVATHVTTPSLYTGVITLIHDTLFKTILGQGLDSRMGQGGVDIAKFTMDTYKSVVEYKTSYYTFHLPCTLAMILAGRTKEDEYGATKKVLLQIGFMFQMQDDFLDCYGDPIITGKVGTDIEEGKCTWLIVKAKELASPEQFQVLSETYGRPAQVDSVKEIYAQLGIPLHFKRAEYTLYKEIWGNIQQVPLATMRKPLHLILNSIYRRNQ